MIIVTIYGSVSYVNNIIISVVSGIQITDSKTHEVKTLDMLAFEAGAF